MIKRRPIIIVEDHPIMRESLQEFLSEVPGIEVCGATATGEEALLLCDKLKPEIALIDVSLPGMSGLELVEKLSLSHPEIILVMLSGHQEITYVRRALSAGARGYVLKGDPQDILAALEEVGQGRNYFTPELRPALQEFSEEESKKRA